MGRRGAINQPILTGDTTMLMTLPQPKSKAGSGPDQAPTRALQGRSAIVTGSSSGIGLGIARALAKAGADVMLNGFGDAAEIDRIPAGLADEAAVKGGWITT